MNSREFQIIKKLKTNQITNEDIQELIDIKKKSIQEIKIKPVINCYDEHVKNYCISSFDEKKNELIDQYYNFLNLYEYLKLQNTYDSQKIMIILNNIENELLLNL